MTPANREELVGMLTRGFATSGVAFWTDAIGTPSTPQGCHRLENAGSPKMRHARSITV
jgi:hypothetical protein